MVGNPRTETIDERIIRALNLDSEFEMSYEEYSRHLKEAMIAARMTKSRYSSEEAILFGVEFKRVRSKKGRFIIKAKKIKITASRLGLGGFTKPLQMAQKRLLLAPKQKVAGVGAEQDIFSKIDDLLASILSNVAEQNKETKKQTELQRKDSENRKRKQKELGLEKGKQALKNIVSTITKPFQSILDKIINFFVMTFLGRAVFKLLEWFSDPKNKEKINTITKFLKDWWPALVGGFVLFGTRFGKGIRVLTRIAISAIGKLGKASIALLRFAKNNPRVAQLATVGLYAGTQLAQRAFSGGEKEQGFWGGGFARKLFASGGRVSGPGGIDRVPAWLTDGEFVMSKGAVQKYGVGTLEAMNAAGGGTNIPTVGYGGLYAEGGGLIGDPSQLRLRSRQVAGNIPYTAQRRSIPGSTRSGTYVPTLANEVRDMRVRSQKRIMEQGERPATSYIKKSAPKALPSFSNISKFSDSQAKTGNVSMKYSNVFSPNLNQNTFSSFQPLIAPVFISQKRQSLSEQANELRAMRVRSQQRLIAQGQTPATSYIKHAEPKLPSVNLVKTNKPISAIKPLPKKQTQIVNMSVAGQKSAATKNSPTSQEPPMSFSAVHPKGTRIAEAVYGVRK